MESIGKGPKKDVRCKNEQRVTWKKKVFISSCSICCLERKKSTGKSRKKMEIRPEISFIMVVYTKNGTLDRHMPLSTQ